MNPSKRLPLLAFILVLSISCSEDSQKASVNDLSEYARNYLKLNASGMKQNSMAFSGRGNVIDGSFQRLFNSANSSVNGRIAGDSTTNPSDSTIVVNDPWVSCAVVTTTSNEDGSTTTQYDYGDGCYEGSSSYKYLMFGKYAYTFKNAASNDGSLFKETYSYKWTTDNYGGRYYYGNDSIEWYSNGSSQYAGDSQYDTAQHTYTGNFIYSSDCQYRWDTILYTYKGHGNSTYSEKQYTSAANTTEYSTGSDYYKTEVLEPLVMRYDCHAGGGLYTTDVMFYSTYVSGREFIRYKQGDKEGSFEINYGNGECDNKITIIENGKVVEIDLSDQLMKVL